jgi:hypothetical protein
LKKSLKRPSFVRVCILLLVSVLALAGFVHTAKAALTLKASTKWLWGVDTEIRSVAMGDVDGDGQEEIVTGGEYYDGVRNIAQLCLWDSATLGLENVKTWYWTGSTYIRSVAVGDVDGDGQVEVVTGGNHNDGVRNVAQLCVWNGANLSLENVRTWYWTSSTSVISVAVGDVDGDGDVEVATAGDIIDYGDPPGIRHIAQLCLWDGATLALENVRTWVWTRETTINSVAIGHVDGDGKLEVVTGGEFYNGTHRFAQLCVWSGTSLALKDVRTWIWGSQTSIASVAIGDVDEDGKSEIVTGGSCGGGAQLCVWSGASLTLEDVRTWTWTRWTSINSVAIGDVDDDNQNEIMTGGTYNDNLRDVAQLCVWNGATLGLESVATWYWTGSTEIWSLAVGIKMQIVTGGKYFDSSGWPAQLCVWV